MFTALGKGNGIVSLKKDKSVKYCNRQVARFLQAEQDGELNSAY